MNLDQYLLSKSYDLRRVSDDEKSFVLDNIGERIPLLKEPDALRNLVFKYPGFVSDDLGFYSRYMYKIFKMYEDVYTPPRGYLAEDSIIIVGVSPGFSIFSFNEPNWLYGPSTKLLHKILEFDYKWYFTNATKEPFTRNIYNDSVIEKFYPDFFKEVYFFKNHKFIFLGDYDIYDRIIDKCELDKNKILRIYHPSYLMSRGDKIITDIRNEVESFVRDI